MTLDLDHCHRTEPRSRGILRPGSVASGHCSTATSSDLTRSLPCDLAGITATTHHVTLGHVFSSLTKCRQQSARFTRSHVILVADKRLTKVGFHCSTGSAGPGSAGIERDDHPDLCLSVALRHQTRHHLARGRLPTRLFLLVSRPRVGPASAVEGLQTAAEKCPDQRFTPTGWSSPWISCSQAAHRPQLTTADSPSGSQRRPPRDFHTPQTPCLAHQAPADS